MVSGDEIVLLDVVMRRRHQSCSSDAGNRFLSIPFVVSTAYSKDDIVVRFWQL
jgi:hypothetical protein